VPALRFRRELRPRTLHRRIRSPVPAFTDARRSFQRYRGGLLANAALVELDIPEVPVAKARPRVTNGVAGITRSRCPNGCGRGADPSSCEGYARGGVVTTAWTTRVDGYGLAADPGFDAQARLRIWHAGASTGFRRLHQARCRRADPRRGAVGNPENDAQSVAIIARKCFAFDGRARMAVIIERA
jgi:hypothetical protein